MRIKHIVSIIIFPLLFTTIFFSNPAHARVEFGVRGYIWVSDVDAKVQTDSDLFPVDLKADMNISDENFLSLEAFVNFGRTHFIVGYMSPSFTGTSTTTFDFNGITFTGTISSKLEYDQLDGILQFDLIKFNPAITRFYLGIIGQVKYLSGSVEVSDGTNSTKENFDVPIPMLGLGAGFGILKDFMVLEARLTGIAYSNEHAYDGSAMLTISPFPLVKAFGGYKVFDIEVNEGTLNVEYTLKGPFAGIQVSF